MKFYSNCFIEMLKAKIKNPKIKVIYCPPSSNEAPCPHWIWVDDEGEHDFNCREHLPWYKYFWHKGEIRTMRHGSYQRWLATRQK